MYSRITFWTYFSSKRFLLLMRGRFLVLIKVISTLLADPTSWTLILLRHFIDISFSFQSFVVQVGSLQLFVKWLTGKEGGEVRFGLSACGVGNLYPLPLEFRVVGNWTIPRLFRMSGGGGGAYMVLVMFSWWLWPISNSKAGRPVIFLWYSEALDF